MNKFKCKWTHQALYCGHPGDAKYKQTLMTADEHKASTLSPPDFKTGSD